MDRHRKKVAILNLRIRRSLKDKWNKENKLRDILSLMMLTGLEHDGLNGVH